MTCMSHQESFFKATYTVPLPQKSTTSQHPVMNASSAQSKRSSLARSLPSSPPYRGAKSDDWIQHELAQAAKNAEKNRTIKGDSEQREVSVRRQNYYRQNRSSSSTEMKTAPTAPDVVNLSEASQAGFGRTMSAPATLREVRDSRASAAFKNAEPNSTSSMLQSSIENLIGEWGSALKSIFPEQKITLNDEDTRRDNSGLLILL